MLYNIETFINFAMRRRIMAYGQYFSDFMASLTNKEAEKVKYILSLLEREDRMPVKFIKPIRDGLYELRIAYNGNIYRLFFLFEAPFFASAYAQVNLASALGLTKWFIFDEGCVVVLLNGFQKKTAKTPLSEIKKALKIRNSYYEYKQQTDGCQRGT